MTFALTKNFFLNARGVIFKDSGSVTWAINQATNEITAVASGGGGGSGTVTSVDLADTSGTPIFNTSGGPVVAAGTLDITLKTQTANTVFAGPASGGAAQPTFRALVASDVPAGATGPTGPAGPLGPPGDDGLDGDHGPPGEKGLTGSTGAVGPSGPPGDDGLDGDHGSPGERGPTGLAGAVGPNGPPGDDGLDGDHGPPGEKGVTGSAGAIGPNGPPGDDGLDGDHGPPGERGVTGSTGSVGPNGPPGDDGLDGDHGPPGEKGLTGNTGAIGLNGPPGDDGLDGDHGPPGEKGLTGNTGAIGLNGPPGDDGLDGDNGPPGEKGVTGSTGAVGPSGPPGDDGLDGDAGSPGPTGLTGATGPVGPLGPPGDDGMDGDAGPPGPTILPAAPSVNVTLSVQPGSAATFMRSDAAPALDQTIAPTWTAQHTYTSTNSQGAVLAKSATPVIGIQATGAVADAGKWRFISDSTGQITLQAINDAVSLSSLAWRVTRNQVSFGIVGLVFGNTTDNPTYSFNGSGLFTVGGSQVVGAPTGGNMGAGTINVAGNYYVNGVQIGQIGPIGPPGADGMDGDNGPPGPPGPVILYDTYTPDSLTIPTGFFRQAACRQQWTTTQRLRLIGTARLSIGN